MPRWLIILLFVCLPQGAAIAQPAPAPRDAEVQSLIERASQSMALQDYDDALAAARQALDLSVSRSGEGHIQTLVSLSYIGLIEQERSNLERAAQAFDRSYRGSVALFGPDNPNTIAAGVNFGQVLVRLGEHQRALRFITDLREISVPVLGREHALNATLLNNEAVSLAALGRYAEAEEAYRELLGTLANSGGLDTHEAQLARNNLADVLRRRGQLSAAAEQHRQLLDDRRRLLGDDHPDTRVSALNLAVTYLDMARYPEAEAQLAPMLQAAEAGGMTGVAQADLYDAAAGLYQNGGRYDAAEQFYVRAIELRERSLGADHPRTLSAIVNLAALYDEQRRWGEAETLLLRARSAMAPADAENTPNALRAANNLAAVYSSQGRFAEAAEILEEVRRDYAANLGETHRLTINAANNLAGAYAGLGDLERAEALYTEIEQAVEANLDPANPLAIATQNNVAAFFLDVDRDGEARRILDRAVSRFAPGDRRFDRTYLTLLGNHGHVALRQGDAGAALRSSRMLVAGLRQRQLQ